MTQADKVWRRSSELHDGSVLATFGQSPFGEEGCWYPAAYAEALQDTATFAAALVLSDTEHDYLAAHTALEDALSRLAP